MKKVHLGCGNKDIPGFINIDIREDSHIHYIADIRKLEMFSDEEVDLIYACHTLEHFKRFEIEDILKEWFRILKKGGILRLAVPDFEAIVKVYNSGLDLEKLIGLIHGGQNYEYNYHYISFDFKSLEIALKKVGFKLVHRYDWRKTEHKDYDDFSQAYIPHMDKENGILMSLNVEAVK